MWFIPPARDSFDGTGCRAVARRWPGNGRGRLTTPKQPGLNLAPYESVIGVSDVNLTGHADLVVREKATGDLWLLPGTAGGFKARRFLAEGMGVYDLAG